MKEADTNSYTRDSDIAKWLELACYALILEDNADLYHQVEEAVDMIRNAQHKDGYINTYYTVSSLNYDQLLDKLRFRS